MLKWLLATPPKVGSLWCRPSIDPFKQSPPIEVLEIKKGWVKYWYTDESPKYKYTSTIRRFYSNFKELGEDAPAEALIPVGSIWHNNSALYPYLYKILDVRDGWVKYQTSGTSLIQTVVAEKFLAWYKRYPFTEDFKNPTEPTLDSAYLQAMYSNSTWSPILNLKEDLT